MKNLLLKCKNFVADEKGLETVEYGIIAGLIVAATIGFIVTIGEWVAGSFEKLAGDLPAP